MMVKVFNKVLQVCLSLFFSYMCVYGESAPAVASCTAEKTETVLQMELFQLLSWGIWGVFFKKYNRWSRGKPEWNAVNDGVFYENVTGLTLTRPQCMTKGLFGGQKTEKLCSDWLKSCVIPSRYWEAVFVWPDYWNFSCGNASTGNSFSINAAVCFHFDPLFGSPINWQEIIQTTLGMANTKWIQTTLCFIFRLIKLLLFVCVLFIY